MSEPPSQEGVHIVDAARINAMQGLCDAARIWSRSKGEDRMRAEQGLLRAITAYEKLQREDREADC